ncbi:SixA phosphatase family protein [Sandaracinus amylolyticus]|uniref:SixA phosphatase family protein n=1 Tax=Sandaracinus amylolyticus TaxID=927083 RepID=UPI001F409C37|nr:histidine phosphatase family protein [Sandaracinus amylolyticus]UJR79897.1 Phosphohistidine phosphatase SixA [Sandaracinus amylolyticus]
MDVFVVRHAIAEDAAAGQDDAERALTPDGIRRFERAVKGMRALDLTFERVLHSPWRRARESAELLAPIVSGPLEETPLLAKAPSPALYEALSRHTEEGPIAIVGHQPWLGEAIAWLALGDAKLGATIDLKKGGVVWLEGEPKRGQMRLRAHLPPRVLRALR